MSTRTEKILFMLGFMFVGAVICFLFLALAGLAAAGRDGLQS